MSETTRGALSFSMSMMRAAPTRLPFEAGVLLPSSDENSSASTRKCRPPMVTGIATCGIVRVSQVSLLTSRTCGSGLRAWTSLTSSMSRAVLAAA